MTPERRLVLSCLVDGQSRHTRALAALPGLDWRRVVALIDGAAIGAVVVDALLQAGVDVAALPAPVSQGLWSAYVHNAAQNQMLLADLAAVTALLSAAQIPSVPLKGAALAVRDPRLARIRHMDDIDLLVPADALLHARTVLVMNGHTDDALLTSPRGTAIDLHRRTPGARTPFDAVRAATEPHTVHGVVIHVPTRAALLEQLALHVVVHHGALPRYWPRHVLDVSALDDSASQAPARHPPAPAPLAAGAVVLSRAVHAAVVAAVQSGRSGALDSSLLFPSKRRAALVGAACLGIKAADILAADGPRAGRRMLQTGTEPLAGRVRAVAGRWLGV